VLHEVATVADAHDNALTSVQAAQVEVVV